jgi:hypothetical protein
MTKMNMTKEARAERAKRRAEWMKDVDRRYAAAAREAERRHVLVATLDAMVLVAVAPAAAAA